jgi:hypothetical protein
MDDEKIPTKLPKGLEMFPTRILCIKDFRSKGNELMKEEDSYFTKDKKYNVYVDNRNFKDGYDVQLYTTNDAGHKHIIGNYGDTFFHTYFAVIEEKAFCQRVAKVRETGRMKLVWAPF